MVRSNPALEKRSVPVVLKPLDLLRDRQQSMTARRSRPWKIGVGCPASWQFHTGRGRVFRTACNFLQTAASAAGLDVFVRRDPTVVTVARGLQHGHPSVPVYDRGRDTVRSEICPIRIGKKREVAPRRGRSTGARYNPAVAE